MSFRANEDKGASRDAILDQGFVIVDYGFVTNGLRIRNNGSRI